MKSFVIAQHHGCFLTLQSMVDSGIDDITVIIPGSQVSKYNSMYQENSSNPEFLAFKDYDKAIGGFIKQLNPNIKAYVVDDFDIKNTVQSTLQVIQDLGVTQIVACIMSGALIIKDYTVSAKDALMFKELGMCQSRVYQNSNSLSMYHMLGLPQRDNAFDVNFFVADMSKILPTQLTQGDSKLLSDCTKRKQITVIDREFNGKDDVLIGSAISARQTIAHNLNIQAGYVVNLWNKSIKSNSSLKSDEIFGYPLNFYGKYVRKVSQYLPKSTVAKIITNSDDTDKATSGLYECVDIIDP